MSSSKTHEGPDFRCRWCRSRRRPKLAAPVHGAIPATKEQTSAQYQQGESQRSCPISFHTHIFFVECPSYPLTLWDIYVHIHTYLYIYICTITYNIYIYISVRVILQMDIHGHVILTSYHCYPREGSMKHTWSTTHKPVPHSFQELRHSQIWKI